MLKLQRHVHVIIAQDKYHVIEAGVDVIKKEIKKINIITIFFLKD